MGIERDLLLFGYGWIAGHAVFSGYLFARFAFQSDRTSVVRSAALLLVFLLAIGILVIARALYAYGAIEQSPTLLFTVVGCVAALILAGVGFRARRNWRAITR